MLFCFAALALLSAVMAMPSYDASPAQEQPYGVPPAQQGPSYPLEHIRVWLDPVPGHRHHHHHHHGHGFYPGFPIGWPYPYYGWDLLSNPFYVRRHHHKRHSGRHSHSHHDSGRDCDSRDSRDC